VREKKNSFSFFQYVVISAVILLFAALYATLSINNRPAADDFEFMNNLRANGLWNGMVVYWQSWNTRWLSILFLNAVYGSYNLLSSFFLYHLITLGFLNIALYKFCGSLFAGFSLDIPKRDKILLSSLLLVSFFFLAFDAAESFFWVNDNTMYLWSVIFILYGSSELIKKEYNFTSYAIAGASFFYIGAAFESYAAIALLLLAILLVYELLNKNKRNRKRINLLLVSILFLSLSFSVELLGNGWRNRHEILGTPTLTSAFLITAKALVKMFVYYLPPKIHWLILFFLAWIGVGIRWENNINLKKGFFIKLILVFSLATFIILFPSCYLLSETPPFRTWTLICFLLSLTIAIAAFAFGQSLSKNKKAFAYFSAVAFIFIISLQAKGFLEQKKTTIEYANAYDARAKILRDSKLNNAQGIIELIPLPPSGMLYSAEISSDTNNYRNRHLRDYFQLKASLKKGPSQE
jgi:hypothetical protein